MRIGENSNQQSNLSTAVQAVIFDLDGVLMNSEALAFQSWQAWAARFGGRLPDDAFAAMVGISAEETAEYVMRRAGVQFDPAESVAWIWREMAEHTRLRAQPLPGAVELVRALAGRGLPLAVASNSIAAYVTDALTGLGLSGCFPVQATIDQVPAGKPAPDVYLRAAERLAVDPRRCLAVEDSRVGVQAAAAAGMRVIAVPGEQDHPGGFDLAYRIYPSLAAVLGDLDHLLAG